MLAPPPVPGIVRLSPSEERMPETSEDQALPALVSELRDLVVRYLRQETLEAQNAQIDEISGATMTSDAFIESLQAALVKAHLAKAAN